MSAADLENLSKDNVIWLWCKCDSQNMASFTYHSFELSNPYDPLRNQSVLDISSPMLETFCPQRRSSPASQSSTTPIPRQPIELTTDSDPSMNASVYGLPSVTKNLRTLVVNCNSIQGKTSDFQTAVSYIKPDIILGSELKLSPDISDAEVFPPGYVM